MSVKVIIEFLAKPGQRSELQSLLASTAEQFAPIVRERGGLSFSYHEVPDNPDLIVEIGEWVTIEAREALLEEAMASGSFGPLMELLAQPPKATYLLPLT